MTSELSPSFLYLLVLPFSMLAFFSAMSLPCLGSTILLSYNPSNSSEKGESSLLTFPTKVLDSLTLNDLTLV